ncbi:MAG: putative lipopolysaccharide heptosyltransferase III [Betaproteobacteria bacterium]|nr:MAG: putative lipopolysaccharide heptosyltransferase III [Betaproteobacteria bacterium]
MTARFALPRAPATILVIVTRRIGDVLLTTPLIRSLKQAWPSANVDVLVFRGTEGVLAGNPDIGKVIAVPPRQSLREAWKQVSPLSRQYDLALSTSPSDRPTIYAWLAGRRRIGVMAAGAKHVWKRILMNATVPFENRSVHTVIQNLWLADLLGLPRRFEMTFTWSPEDDSAIEAVLPEYAATRYAVLHVYPKFAYKMWAPEQWCALADELSRQGFRIVLSGSKEPHELDCVARLAASMSHSPLNVAGKLEFRQLALLLSKAALYVGPDTVTTHLAAAVGAPTVALFGPSNPVKWGPWPCECTAQESPWSMRGTQRVGNVALVQGFGACVPCLEEGCARDESSKSVCLQMLAADTVMQSIRKLVALAERPPASAA